MHNITLCLTQLLQLLQKNKSIVANDLIIYHLYNIRNSLSVHELRAWFVRFVRVGFNPFSEDVDEVSALMFKSIRSILSPDD